LRRREGGGAVKGGEVKETILQLRQLQNASFSFSSSLFPLLFSLKKRKWRGYSERGKKRDHFAA